MVSGVVRWVPVDEMMSWRSCDSAGVRLKEVLRWKREDEHYPKVVEALRENGFMRPLTSYVEGFDRYMGDGHHRLAAAIDLGLTEVPVLMSENGWDMDLIADDSGDWDGGECFYPEPVPPRVDPNQLALF